MGAICHLPGTQKAMYWESNASDASMPVVGRGGCQSLATRQLDTILVTDALSRKNNAVSSMTSRNTGIPILLPRLKPVPPSRTRQPPSGARHPQQFRGSGDNPDQCSYLFSKINSGIFTYSLVDNKVIEDSDIVTLRDQIGVLDSTFPNICNNIQFLEDVSRARQADIDKQLNENNTLAQRIIKLKQDNQCLQLLAESNVAHLEILLARGADFDMDLEGLNNPAAEFPDHSEVSSSVLTMARYNPATGEWLGCISTLLLEPDKVKEKNVSKCTAMDIGSRTNDMPRHRNPKQMS